MTVVLVQSALAADMQHYANAVTPLLDAADGKTIGSLQPGTPMEVVGQSGNAVHVILHGWSAEGAGAVVIAAPDRRIVLISGYTGRAEPGASQTVTGTLYREVTIDGWAASAALVDDIQVVWKRADALLSEKCSSCHALPEASSFRANQWPALMKTQAVNAGLDSNETALLTAYLQYHARQ